MRDRDERVRRWAIRCFFFYDSGPATWGNWDKVVDALAEPDVTVRLDAVRTVDLRYRWKLGDGPFPAAAVGRLLEDGDELVRCAAAAAAALSTHWGHGPDQLKPLLRRLRCETSPLVRMRAAVALSKTVLLLDPKSVSYEPVREALRDKDPIVRGQKSKSALMPKDPGQERCQ